MIRHRRHANVQPMTVTVLEISALIISGKFAEARAEKCQEMATGKM